MADDRSKTASEIRERLVRALEADLVGPFDALFPREQLSLPPSRWYLTGFLAPTGARETRDPTSDDELGVTPEDEDEETAAPEPEAKQKNFYPASMGMSVLLPPGSPNEVVRASISFADYACTPEDEDDKKPKHVWSRVPCGPLTTEIPLDSRLIERGIRVAGTVGVTLRGKLATAEAPWLEPGVRALSLFVVNERNPSEERGRADEQFLFQVKLAVEFDRGFIARPNHRDENSDEWDDRVADLQFRDRCEWAVGHNVSVVAPQSDGPVTRIETTWLPRYEVRRVVTHEEEGVQTSMETLAELSTGTAMKDALLPLVDAYGRWVETQRTRDVGAQSRREARDELMKHAEAARARIRAGIELLENSGPVLEAFRLSNRAMAMAARQRSPERYLNGKAPSWRLFQLAFVLMNLKGMAEPTSADREIVDLIFFPTGGGKTEAYLGVIAFALILRRLTGAARPDKGLGVTVLLRYTLRLLTLDQLGRAATLMCALEVIRKDRRADLGEERFSVGLWVGRSASANTMAQVKERIVEYKNNPSRSASSPFPLTHCPWCQHELGRDNLKLAPSSAKPEEVIVSCMNAECIFRERVNPDGLPVVFVDDQIYRELPSLVIATVDKFAMLPWRGETGMLFGRAQARSGRRFFGPMDASVPKDATPLPGGLRPPELIVQDELHLISGPLGTMVGLYETAIEWLSTFEGEGHAPVRPKVIASTATVRRAREQIGALFGRSKRQFALFPPPGVDDSETWFARVDHASPGRLYVGVAAPGRSLKAILLRTYVDILCAAQKNYDPKGAPDQAADAYMTLAGYFNSLRELGGMRRLVEDDVRSRGASIQENVPRNHGGSHPHFARRMVQPEPVELTSRESTASIASSKARLGKPHADKNHADVLLASNMISVGVDIDRLGAMVIAGQPKTTSEYIQASSRVGRQHPGLAVTCFNVRRPRDRSHFERFAAYHASFYRFVEAQSLTPFSGPALDRGLAGTLVAMTRLATPDATVPEAAMAIRKHRKHAEAALQVLADRGAQQPGVRGKRHDDVRNHLVQRGRDLLDEWDTFTTRVTKEAAGSVSYSRFDVKKSSRFLLRTRQDEPKPAMASTEAKFTAPTSMRDVEPTVHLWIERGKLGGKV